MKDAMIDLQPKIFTVSEITKLIRDKLEETFPLVLVTGEVSNLRPAASGHIYFSLKDEKCQLKAVMWRSDAVRIKFELKEGLQLICRGRINVYEARGEYQIVVDQAEPKGKGALQLAFEQLKEKLRAEGLFDEARKKKLPFLPKKIGIVTSARGAALVDILRTLERRFAKLGILIYPALVQGEGAAEQIAEGIDYLGRLGDIDAIIVGRGGGSIEDLWAFNEEKVARAIFRCPVPVISAVGHEVDFTIADFVADIRASTPTAAAEMVVEKEEAFAETDRQLRAPGASRRALRPSGAPSGCDGPGPEPHFPKFQGQVDEYRPGDRRARITGLERHAGRAEKTRRGAGQGRADAGKGGRRGPAPVERAAGRLGAPVGRPARP